MGGLLSRSECGSPDQPRQVEPKGKNTSLINQELKTHPVTDMLLWSTCRVEGDAWWSFGDAHFGVLVTLFEGDASAGVAHF